MNKYLKLALNLCVVALVVGICFWADGALADAFQSITDKASDAFDSTRNVVFVLGAFTLVAIAAIGAVFYFIVWPLVQRTLVTQTCRTTYGPDFYAEKADGEKGTGQSQAKVYKWKCTVRFFACCFGNIGCCWWYHQLLRPVWRPGYRRLELILRRTKKILQKATFGGFFIFSQKRLHPFLKQDIL